MCLGIPARIIEYTAATGMARVDMVGVIRDVDLSLLDGPWAAGDYVVVHSGFALDRLSAAEARETLALLTAGAAYPTDPP